MIDFKITKVHRSTSIKVCLDQLLQIRYTYENM